MPWPWLCQIIAESNFNVKVGQFYLIINNGNYCEEHAPLPQRTSAADCGYNARWQKASVAGKRFIKDHPLCAVASCLKEYRMIKVTVVDHIVPYRGDPVLFWNESNWLPLCKHCHDVKTMENDRYKSIGTENHFIFCFVE